ncbi:MAG: fibronectin type III domain-containing protein [Syntrophobacteraceae bacterium]|jgi:hypothetical protein
MLGKGMIIAILAVALMATASWAQGGGGGSGGFGVPMDLLMPDPPTGVTATAGNGEATVSFAAPKVEGAKPITSYTVTSHPGEVKVSGRQSPITVKGLINGRPYSFTVTASSSVGTGLPSQPSGSVTPTAQ